MPNLIWQGERIKDALTPVSRDYLVSTDRIYNFHIIIQGRDFGKAIDAIWLTEKNMLTKIMDSYDMTDPYGKCLWWGAGREEIIVQIKSNITRPVSKIWDILRDVFTKFFPKETIVWGKTFEGPIITEKRTEEGRGMNWWEKVADFFRSLGIEVKEHQAWIYAAIILGGTAASLYFISSIIKKLPGRT